MPRTYPPHEIDAALLAYRTTGSYARAEAQTGIARSTLHQWIAGPHAARYKEISDKHGPILEEQLVARMQDVADYAAEVARNAVTGTQVFVEAGDAKNAALMSNTVKNLVLSTGIATDKALLLQGRPNVIHANQTSDDDLKAIARMLHVTLEGTATEIKPKELTSHGQ